MWTQVNISKSEMDWDRADQELNELCTHQLRVTIIQKGLVPVQRTFYKKGSDTELVSKTVAILSKKLAKGTKLVVETMEATFEGVL